MSHIKEHLLAKYPFWSGFHKTGNPTSRQVREPKFVKTFVMSNDPLWVIEFEQFVKEHTTLLDEPNQVKRYKNILFIEEFIQDLLQHQERIITESYEKQGK